MSRNNSPNPLIFVAICVVLLAVVCVPGAIFAHTTVDNVSFQVSDLERISTGSGDTLSHKYLVFTNVGETFENTDSWWHLKFGSSDIQGRLTVGETYNAKVYGWRVPFLSWYRNIIEIK